MLKYITITFALILAIMDLIAYKRLVRNNVKKSITKSFAITAIVINVMPLLVPLLFIFSNGTFIMKLSMVLLTVFIVITLCRSILYLFWLFTENWKLLYCGVVVSFAVFLLFMYGVFVTRTDYKINELELSFKNLPVSFDGFRVAFISDMHVGAMYNAEAELEKIVDIISGTDADVILFGGDLINFHHSELTPPILEKLSFIKGKQGTLAVLGNHDTGAYFMDSLNTPRSVNKKLVEEKLRGIGWLLLRDSTKFFYSGNDSIAITGIDYTDRLLDFKHKFNNIDNYDVSHVYSMFDDSIFNITISHLPMLWYELCDKGYSDLTLSGHIHSMQLKYDIFGVSLSPAAWMYEEWSGLYERERGKLYINDGLGTVGFCARLGARPEITVIKLKKL